MAIFNIRLPHIRLYWRHTSAIPCYNSDHISTEGGHAEHVLVTRISNKMDDSSTDKQIFEFSIFALYAYTVYAHMLDYIVAWYSIIFW